ncbi:MAG: hypothetical protein WC314_19045 [Vulcanimicrobiota bacterium]
MCYVAVKNKKVSSVNSLDRRGDERVNKGAEILTFGIDTKFRKAHVIECSQDGARVVLSQAVSANEVIGVVVIRGRFRTRTFARVAWTQSINSARTVAGLEFMKLGYDRAS